MDLEYTVTEIVSRDGRGQVVQLDYQFEETTTVETTSSAGMARQNREKRSRSYDATITRDQYKNFSSRQKNALSFDSFVIVLRPFILGFYAGEELERAFNILDRDHSGKIHVNELGSFLPILNESIDDVALLNYIRKIDQDTDENMNFDEFRALVLRGIGRDIICNHL
ncbi:unnamed protein product [Rotaria socialis]|uniref:EF-hand domain-containing protein n=1 Tax=Rotaria socialis TaxID=392032 RepID=A0A818R5X5_9BILA|nr:unnamed protein product [Rotaria socialis]CAF3585379.1 unnamed protein product [Rotaria socialis]CAF3645134.1 unnamed protein product [Rotaria socialis]CAF3690469.1 unnamed protein product [Rotaria socialis]CAF3751509.1 unnamed protein product [Rotaria socialis]